MSRILSMILPAYNVEKYIENCIESCERQDIPHDSYEIIVVNDGSIDGTLEIVESLAKRYVNIKIVNQPNQGVSVARNNGFKEAQGKYIWFIDPDDKISTNCLSSLISIMESKELEALVVAPRIAAVLDFPPPTTSGIHKDDFVSDVFSGVEFLLDETNCAVAPWCFIYLSSFWRDGRFSFIKGIRYEDSELIPYVTSKVTRLAKLTQFSCYHYIQHKGSLMNSSVTKEKILSLSVIVNTHMKYASETDVQDLRLWFEKSASSHFISGVKHILKWNGDTYLILSEFLNKIKARPKRLYGANVFQKAYQHIVLNYPQFYVRIHNLIYGK